MAGIKFINSRGGKIEGTRVFGYEDGIVAIDSEDIEVINSLVSESPLDDPMAFIEYIENSSDFQSHVEGAKNGNKESVALLKGILEKITVETVETVVIAYKVYLKSHGIQI